MTDGPDKLWELPCEEGGTVLFAAGAVTALQDDPAAGVVRVTCGARTFTLAAADAAPVLTHFRTRLRLQQPVVQRIGDGWPDDDEGGADERL